jgi:predicted ATPase/DNA-binding CsgD family transcriptional regulator
MSDLPLPLTSFIGRAREVSEITRWLLPTKDPRGDEQRRDLAGLSPRLITITGAGGVGKTRLALQVCRDIAAQRLYADSVHVVSLAPISDPTLIVPTIAKTLGVNEAPDRLLFESLKTFLRNKQWLLLLDNFEQVIDAAPLLTELLSACEQLRLLVTSREALRVRGEQEFPLSPLALPDLVVMPDKPAVETLLQYPSVALFVQRAQESKPDFQLTSENALAVAELCARLDGLPLAIELAAPHIKLLSPQAMLGRLQESPLRLLTGGARDLPARQRTLRATIQWSYDLLDDDERKVFRWLSVFVGGCALEGDIGYWILSGQDSNTQYPISNTQSPMLKHRFAVSNIELATALVNKNLMRQSEVNGEPRLSMVETIREFGLEQLRQSGEWAAAQRAHAEYILSLVEATAPKLAGAEQQTALNQLGRELDNLRAALRWMLENHETESALQMASGLSRFWFMRGYWNEGRRWMEEVIADCRLRIADWRQRSGTTEHRALDKAAQSEMLKHRFAVANRKLQIELYAQLLREAGSLIRYQGDFARARTLCEQSLALYRELGDSAGIVTALIQLCRLLSDQGDWAAARVKVEEALTLINTVNDPRAKADVHFIAGTNALVETDFANAQTRLTESLRWMRLLGDKAGIASALNGLSFVATELGDYATAQSLLDESFKLSQEVGDKRSGGRALFSQARLAYKQGHYAQARAHFEAVWSLVHHTNDFNSVWTVEGLAMICAAQDMPQWAVRLFSLSEAMRESFHIPQIPLFQADSTETLASARSRLSAEAFAAAWAEGRKLPLDDVLKVPQPATPASKLPEPLTTREFEVLQLLAQDLNAPQIAERLVVSPRTVHAHLRAIYDKLGVKSHESAVRVATERGLISANNSIRET